MSPAIRLAPRRLVILLACGLPLATQAGPQTPSVGLNLEMLDLNGAPFRAFHLGHYAKGLDDRHPAATTLPTEELNQAGQPGQEASERYTGVGTIQAGPIPARPDISTLLMQSYDQDLLQPAYAY